MGSSRHIGPQVKSLANLIKRRFDRSIAGSMAENVTGMQGWILGYLVRNADRNLFQRDIEAEFRIRRSTVSGILNLMERNGLITREPVPEDGRLKKLVLTSKALCVHEEIVRCIRETESSLVKGLTEEELDTFFGVVEKIKKNLGESDPPPGCL